MGMLNHHFAAAALSAQSDSLPLTAANLCNRAIELLLIMLPRPRGAMRRATACPTRQTPVRLVSRTCAQSCSVISRKGAVAATPALLTRIWIEIGRAHARPQVTNAHLVCRLLLEQKNIISKY